MQGPFKFFVNTPAHFLPDPTPVATALPTALQGYQSMGVQASMSPAFMSVGIGGTPVSAVHGQAPGRSGRSQRLRGLWDVPRGAEHGEPGCAHGLRPADLGRRRVLRT